MNNVNLIQQTEHLVWVGGHQMNLRDSGAQWDGSYDNDDCWDTGIGVSKGVVGITNLTRAAGITPVMVEHYKDDPGQADINEYSGVMEATITVDSGKLLVEATDTSDVELSIPAGTYMVRAYYGNDETSTYDGDDGANHIRIVLFPSTASTEIEILKEKETQDDPVKEYTGSKTEKELFSMLTSPLISYRCLAVVGLIQLQKFQEVRDIYKDAADSVKKVFTSALGFAGEESVRLLEELSSDKDANIRLRVSQACEMLLNHFEREDLPVPAEVKNILVKLSEDEDEHVKEFAQYIVDEKMS